MDKKLNFPFIAHTINNNIQHFVVVLKISNNKVLINDPAKGILYVDIKDFNKIYTKIAIVFNNNNFSIKKEVLNKKFIILITIIILFLALLNVSYSYLLSYIIDNHNSSKIINVLIIFMSFGILKELINFIKERVLIKYQILTDRAITIPSLKKIINLPHNFYQKRPVGELISKINDLSYIKEMIFAAVQVLFVNLIVIFISLIFLFLVNKYIFLLNIIITLFAFLYNKKFYSKHSYKNYDLQLKNEVLSTKISDGINSIISIKNLCKEKYLEDKIITSYNDTLDSYEKLSFIYQNKNFLFHTAIFILNFSTIFLCIKTNNTISNMLFITYLEGIIFDGLNQVSNLWNMYANFKSSYIRIKDIYNETEIDNDTKLIKIDNICFKNVSYHYKKKTIFKDFNLNINKNDFIMINGPSGSGKTSLFKILTRQIKHSGKGIFINGKSINDYTEGYLRRSITYVDQKIKFFNDTVLENITLGTKLDLRQYFKQTLEEILKERDIDYTTVIDNTNSNLSGGELMLLSIAQALNNSGNVIIFDETTSQMDVSLERKILSAIKKDYKDKTIILISHRLSNKDLFDKIINFSDKRKNKTSRRKRESIKTKRIKTN